VIFVLGRGAMPRPAGLTRSGHAEQDCPSGIYQAEAATLLGMSPRAISYKFPLALDRLTEQLLENELLSFRIDKLKENLLQGALRSAPLAA